jgi:HAD superfamily hydrolase (TIGR01509 family)
MDGTLTDSDSIHYESFRQVLLELTPNFNDGIPISKEYYFKQMSGSLNSVIAPKIFPEKSSDFHATFIQAKEEKFMELTKTMKCIDGLEDILNLFDTNGIPCIVVTNAPRVEAVHTLKKLGLDKFLKNMVIAEECGSFKPFPEPYLEGLKRLGLDAKDCLAFEDSIAGCISAHSAGLCTVGILSSQSKEKLIGCGVYCTINDYYDKNILNQIQMLLEKVNL